MRILEGASVRKVGHEALTFLRQELRNGKPFARELDAALPFSRGSMVVFLPDSAPEVLLRDFDEWLTRDQARYSEGRTLDLIERFRDATRRPAVIVEPFQNREDVHLRAPRFPCFTVGEHAYYFLARKHLTRQSVRSLFHSARDYPFVAAITQLPKDFPPSSPIADVPPQVLRDLAVSAAFVIVKAYDATGYLLWASSPPSA
jgi:hypothetical protein